MAKINRKKTRLVVQQKFSSRQSSRSSISCTIAKKRCNDIHLVLQRKDLSRSRRSYRVMLRYLARAGCRITSTNSRGETALHLAVKRDDFEAASQLVRLGADVNRKNLGGETPLQVAVVNWSHADVLTEIIPNGIGILYANMNFYGLRTLALAVAGRDQDALNATNHLLVKMLLDAGADADTKDNKGCSSLQYAIYTGDLELITMLIDAGADVNYQYSNIGVTPLHDAVLCGNEAVVNLLLSHDANVATSTNRYLAGDTALHWASILNIGNSHFGIIVKLLEFGSDLHAENTFGRSSFNYIVETGDVKLVKLCIDEYKADLKKLAHDRSNALALAVRNLNENVMNLVLENGIEIDQKCQHGRTPLHSASHLSMLENVRRLISLGADVNAKDESGLTPLALCVLAPSQRPYLFNQMLLALDRFNYNEEKFEVMRLLLEHGSDVNQKVSTDNEPQDQLTIFELVMDYGVYDAELDIMIEHVAEMEARLNKPLLNDYNRMVLDVEPTFQSYYKTCKAQLTAMKSTKIKGTTISYFSVLTEPHDVVARYARNKDFVKEFEAGDYQTAYDSYASKLEEKFDAAIARQKVIEQASAILSATLRFADSSHPAFEIILEYLTEADVKILISST